VGLVVGAGISGDWARRYLQKLVEWIFDRCGGVDDFWLLWTVVVDVVRWCSKARTTLTCKRRFVLWLELQGGGSSGLCVARGCGEWFVDGVKG
jgi:hypothetical protein